MNKLYAWADRIDSARAERWLREEHLISTIYSEKPAAIRLIQLLRNQTYIKVYNIAWYVGHAFSFVIPSRQFIQLITMLFYTGMMRLLREEI